MAYPARRMSLSTLAPAFYKAMIALDRESRQFGLEPLLLELVKCRASQINGCAFCLDMHTKDALAAGETEMRLYVLSAWREAPFYSDRERVALALTEAMTRLPDGVPDDVYDDAARRFSQEELAGLITVITVINGWNRIAVTTQLEPGHYRPGDH